ncbi:2-oxoacid:acceptor oxidoreductase family protein [Thiocapsa sp.]|uniref:2-oxoacid:acceptor oxidoreductase family protein n=1 Tax=Thiocapsa sp. TaxID=2024551 RepID=UPI002B87627B|nr:2-oxoacid:acceptor oxidoreductase family protein [Thiocapsa sp.]HSO81833.1 2-oxoacid:acceptor oxidoreductase family protein [Thiocapsa sp.]
MVRIRFHGRGGQGMKTASRILGSACFLSGYQVQDAPRYGAERRGAPIFAYVRVDDRPIRERGIIVCPDLAVVADPSLISVPAAGVLVGLDAHSVLLVNSPEAPEVWRDRLGLANTPVGFRLADVLAGSLADRADLPVVGTVCAAAAARLLGFVTLERLEQAIRDELAGLGASVLERNLEQARAAFEQVASRAGCVTPGPAAAADAEPAPNWVDLPFEEACISAPVIHASLTSEAVPTGLWRTLRPVIDDDRCNGCWWVCSAFCPDGAIRVEDGRPKIDYDHCKGCLVCVAQCPPHAIDTVPEADIGSAQP